MQVVSSTAEETLQHVQAELHVVLQTTEEVVCELVRGFTSLAKQSETIVTLAGSIVQCVEGEQVAALMPQVCELGALAKQFVADRLRGTAGILETVGAVVDLLRQLGHVTEGQSKVATRIRVLNILTRIEVAHLGEVGTGFEYLARELVDFSQSLADNTEQLGRQTNESKASIERTRSMLSTELPALRTQLSRVEQNLEEDLQQLESGIANLAQEPLEFHQSASSLDQQIAGVVMAVQGHDITRQQIEHVCSAVQVVSGLLPVVESDAAASDENGRHACAGLAIQVAQLHFIRQTFCEWAERINRCIDGIRTISASELVGLGGKVQAQEQSLVAQLENIDQLEKECASYSGRIRETLEGIANLSDLVTDHMKKSESARSRLQLLTFNSIVEATRLGAQADTISVIASDIGAVSSAWGNISDRSSQALEQILQLSGEIGSVMTAFSEEGNADLNEAQKRTRDGLSGLIGVAACSVAKGEEIASIGESMRQQCVKIQGLAMRLEECFNKIDTSAGELEVLNRDLLRTAPGWGDGWQKAGLEQLFAASYTTEAERNVLHAAVYGSEAVVMEPANAGGEIELF